jgi:hypothetical protein
MCVRVCVGEYLEAQEVSGGQSAAKRHVHCLLPRCRHCHVLARAKERRRVCLVHQEPHSLRSSSASQEANQRRSCKEALVTVLSS